MPRISKYICIAAVLIWALVGTFPVFGQVMKSENYRLELEEGEIAPVEGFEGKTATGKTAQNFITDIKDKLLSILSPDHPDFWKAVLLVGVIVILLALFVSIIARKWFLKNKEKSKE